MAWEHPRRGRPYYTRSRKVAGRVVREYVGGGVLGELAARYDAAIRADRAAKNRAWSATAVRFAELDADIALIDEAVRAVVVSELEAAGYHQHGRGEWRRRRHG